MAVAAGFVGAGQVDLGREGATGVRWPALKRNAGAGPALRAVAQMADHRSHIVAKPLVLDHVVLDIAIGDATGGRNAPGRRAEDAVAGVGADDH